MNNVLTFKNITDVCLIRIELVCLFFSLGEKTSYWTKKSNIELKDRQYIGHTIAKDKRKCVEHLWIFEIRVSERGFRIALLNITYIMDFMAYTCNISQEIWRYLLK